MACEVHGVGLCTAHCQAASAPQESTPQDAAVTREMRDTAICLVHDIDRSVDVRDERVETIAAAFAGYFARGQRSRDAELERVTRELEELPERFSLSVFVEAGMPLAIASLALMVARRVLEDAERERDTAALAARGGR